ncbi:MAG: SDR family NAD(P)-dependent oxidoreductase, partial [Sphingobacteriales bacterium]
MLSLDLTTRNALIAGSTQGIGLASAQALASLGANCTLIARNEASLKQALTTLDQKGGQQHNFLVADFSSTDSVSAAIKSFAAENTVHILVNNTGGPPAGPITAASTTDFLNAFQQHLICNHILATALID